MRTPAWLQRIEARIALALSRADKGALAEATAANHFTTANAAPIAPANPVVFQVPFTTIAGHVRVTCMFSVDANGGTLAVGDTLIMNGVRDGAAVPLFQSAGVIATANELTPGAKQVSIQFEDTVAAGSTHNWGAEISNSNAHTQGAAAPGIFQISIQDLPG